MSGYAGSSASGSMKDGDGHTTVVGAPGGLSGKDKEVLCNVMCNCKRIGVATRPDARGNSRILRQSCVAQRLNAMNEASIDAYGAPTEYRPEVAYDMSPTPPAPPVPIMSDEDPLTPHTSLMDWIWVSWPGRMRGYLEGKKAGIEQIRRPDVVIVRDPSQPPVQSNIKSIVEMKFDDLPGKGQLEAYVRIAGDKSKVVTMKPADCGCRDEDPEAKPVRSTQAQSEVDELFGTRAGGMSRATPAGLPSLPPGLAFP